MRLTPRGGRDALIGVIEDSDGRPAVSVRLAAPPVEGAANRALIAFLADALGIRKSDIAILSGERARLKIVRLSGDPATIVSRLNAWLALAPRPA